MAAASSSSETTNEGPVLGLITKRLRALRKKLNRISQMEDAISQGKTLNKEQEETLRSKPSVLAGIDELEKLRQPMAQAVNQEIQIALEKIDEKTETPQNENNAVSALLQLIYFGSVFDVKTLMRAHENILTRTHERSCCLTYDYVTDDDTAGDPLREWDLDLISNLGGLLVSRPMNSSLSHKNALEKCVEHAKLWIAKSEQPIEPNSSITYAGLREKLDKIIASEYFTTTPEIKAPVEVAAAAGNYTAYQMPVHESMVSPVTETVPVESSALEYEQEAEESSISPGNENHNDDAGHVEEVHEGVSEVENTSRVETQIIQSDTENGIADTVIDQNSKGHDLKEQQHASRTSHHRGGRGVRRGYGNGRGGRGGNRGGGGGYQNGRDQFYDQSGGHIPRNYNNYRGRGGRGMGGGNYNYQSYAAGHAQEAS